MSAIANAAEAWNAGPGTTKPGVVSAGPVETEETAVTTRSSWQTFTLNVSENGWTLPKLQAPHGRGHVNFRASLHGRPRSTDRSEVL